MITDFAGKALVVRVDEETVRAAGSTFIDDLGVLAEAKVRPIVVAPDGACARDPDAAMLPHTPGGIGHVQAGLLNTLTDAGYIPVIEPTAFAVFASGDASVAADDVAGAIAAAVDAVRAIFFHAAGGVADPQTQALIEELTPAEALALAGDARVPADLRAAIRAAALGVRSGGPAAQIVNGRIAHATIVEFLTARHVGTQVAGGIYLAA
jgi:acetylglutamate kinase